MKRTPQAQRQMSKADCPKPTVHSRLSQDGYPKLAAQSRLPKVDHPVGILAGGLLPMESWQPSIALGNSPVFECFPASTPSLYLVF